jgi:glycerol-3-phosphate dehydrogenase (NAD(P)+)
MTDKKISVCVLGGNFGTTLGLMAARGAGCFLAACDEKIIAQIMKEHENKRYMPGFRLDPRLQSVLI